MADGYRLQPIRDFVVQIRHTSTDAIVGTGFVAREGIVTCAHVVRDAGVDPWGRDGLDVGIYYPEREGRSSITKRAKVAACFDQHDDDVVLLYLVDDSSPLGPELAAKFGSAKGSEAHEFLSFGYQRLQNYLGLPALGKILGLGDRLGRVAVVDPRQQPAPGTDDRLQHGRIREIGWQRTALGQAASFGNRDPCCVQCLCRRVFIGGDFDERPVHPVRITRPFYLGKHEVTQTQWEGAMGHNPSSFRDPAGPVQNVSWHDARMFTERLNGVSALRGRYASTPLDVSGMTYTLPTEAQWEYACRAGTTTAFCFGDSEDTLGEYAWHAANSGQTTHAVGQLKPNAWALYDMHGNVWEWCADWDAADYYVRSPRIDPGGPPTGSTRSFRSGSWGHYSCAARSAFRRSLSPDFRYHSFGVRLALVFDRESGNGKHTQQR